MPSLSTAQEQAINYMSLAQGTYPVEISANATDLKVGMEHAIQIIDGNPTPFIVNRKPGDSEARIDIVYKLPALTTFSRLSVPNISETPSPSQTFFKHVRVYGALDYEVGGGMDAFTELAALEMQTHSEKNARSELKILNSTPVRWIKVSLIGGINVETEKSYFEFSELFGEGEQEPAQLEEGFTGKWKGRGVKIEMVQDGATVNGCYDANGELSGTVSGNVLRATGTAQDSVCGTQ